MSEFNEMFEALVRVVERSFDEVDDYDFREAQANQRRVQDLKREIDRLEDRKTRRSFTAEILETDVNPFGLGLIETGTIRVVEKYYFVEIHEEIFDGRRHARVWKADRDGRRKGTWTKYRCGDLRAVARALAAEYR